MERIEPAAFFNLETFAHAELFAEGPVWDALKRIKDYLHSFSLGRIDGQVSERAFLVHPELISIGANSVIEPGAYIAGPCIIGANCTVRHGAYLRGGVIAGDRCVFGHTTEVKNSIFLNGAQAAHFAYVGDSILGAKCNLGAGTKLANLRFDGSTVCVECNGERIDTGLRKLGSILGDRAQTGCNSVANPGTLIEPGGWVLPGKVARRWIKGTEQTATKEGV